MVFFSSRLLIHTQLSFSHTHFYRQKCRTVLHIIFLFWLQCHFIHTMPLYAHRHTHKQHFLHSQLSIKYFIFFAQTFYWTENDEHKPTNQKKITKEFARKNILSECSTLTTKYFQNNIFISAMRDHVNCCWYQWLYWRVVNFAGNKMSILKKTCHVYIANRCLFMYWCMIFLANICEEKISGNLKIKISPSFRVFLKCFLCTFDTSNR